MRGGDALLPLLLVLVLRLVSRCRIEHTGEIGHGIGVKLGFEGDPLHKHAECIRNREWIAVLKTIVVKGITN